MTLTDVIQYKDFGHAYCSFIDEFKVSFNKGDIIKDPPIGNTLTERENLCILAAATHRLANEYGIEVPAWVYEPIYKMPYPIYEFNSDDRDYQEFLIKDTPIEFASRNIFLGSRVLNRV